MTIVLAAPPAHARYATAAATIRDLPTAMRADRDRHSWTIRQQAAHVAIGADTLTRVAAPGGAAEPAPAYNRRIWQQLAGVWGWR